MSAPETETVENGWPKMSAEEEAEVERAFAEADENERNGVPGIPVDEVLRSLRAVGADAEPLELEPGFEEELADRSRAARELDRQGLLPSAAEHLVSIRARSEHRRAG